MLLVDRYLIFKQLNISTFVCFFHASPYNSIQVQPQISKQSKILKYFIVYKRLNPLFNLNLLTENTGHKKAKLFLFLLKYIVNCDT